MQSQIVLYFLKGLKKLKLWSKKAVSNYFRDILRLEFTKIVSKF